MELDHLLSMLLTQNSNISAPAYCAKVVSYVSKMFMNLAPGRQQVVLQNPGRLAVAVSGPEINPKLTLAEPTSCAIALSIKTFSFKYHYVETISDNRTAHIRH